MYGLILLMVFSSQAQKSLVLSQKYYILDREGTQLPGINFNVRYWGQNPLICFILCWKHLSFLVYQPELI